MYVTHPLGRFSMLDMSAVGVVSVPKRLTLATSLADSFPKTVRIARCWHPVLVCRATELGKTAPEGCSMFYTLFVAYGAVPAVL